MENNTYCIGNWKMNMSLKDCNGFCSEINRIIVPHESVKTIICPPYTLINYYINNNISPGLNVGSQDIAIMRSGSLTGEISGEMLRDLGCNYVIVGHSERRNLLKESDEAIRKKINQCILNKLNPIVCIGENREERVKGDTYKVLNKQLSSIFSSINVPEDLNLIIAYEPIWAIGTGEVATIEIIDKTNSFIDEILNKISNGVKYSLVYGGSVNSKNAKELLQINNLDGFLIGGSSLIADEFCKIHQQCKEKK